jgi:hypothetical protein
MIPPIQTTKTDTLQWELRWPDGSSSSPTRTATTDFASSVPEKRAGEKSETTKMAASPDENTNDVDELRPEYDFRSLRGVVRGKYAARYRERVNVVRIADDIALAFPDEASVNSALREYLREHPTVR